MKTIINREEINVVKVTSQKTESGQAVTGKCGFAGIMIKTDGTNAVTLSIYDGTDDSGDALIPEEISIDGDKDFWTFGVGVSILAETGVYVKVTCSGDVTYQVLYERGGVV